MQGRRRQLKAAHASRGRPPIRARARRSSRLVPSTVPASPRSPGQLDPGIRQIHSGEYRDPSQLADGPVLVVGVGHSGADIAFETAATHRTILCGSIARRSCRSAMHRRLARTRVSRGPLDVVVASHVLTIKTPIGRKARPVPACCPRRSCGSGARSSHRPAWNTTRAGSRASRTASRSWRTARSLDVANVIWCTGFRPDYSWIEPHCDRCRWLAGRAARRLVDARPVFPRSPVHSTASTRCSSTAQRDDASYVVDRIDETRPSRPGAPEAVERVTATS